MPDKNLLFTAVFVKLEGEYVAYIEELPGMSSRGATIGEARRALLQIAGKLFGKDRGKPGAVGADIVRESMAISLA